MYSKKTEPNSPKVDGYAPNDYLAKALEVQGVIRKRNPKPIRYPDKPMPESPSAKSDKS